jgi:hypothetical protein
METEMPDVRIPGGVMHVGGNYKPGDPSPTGYLDWHEWAEIQHKAGLRQKECGRCGKWRYPQELSAETDRMTGKTKRGREVGIVSAVCLKCSPAPTASGSPQTSEPDEHHRNTPPSSGAPSPDPEQ